MTNKFNWKIAGHAGEGVKRSGKIFSKACAKAGLYTADYTEYPSLIRGGHNTYQVVASPEEVYSPEIKLDLLVCLNKNGLTLHKDELTKDTVVLYDAKDDNITIADYSLPGVLVDLPMVEIAKEVGGERLYANTVALGASCYFLCLDISMLNQTIQDIFSKKGDDVVKTNQAAAMAGFEYAQKHADSYKCAFELSNTNSSDTKYSMTGNEAIALGAIAGGLQLYAAYPMTPSSSILHTLAKLSKDAGVVVKHAEDEIGAINMALGASFAGVRSAVGTSGGGFCYMTEAVGLSAVAELPLVIFESMRPGPALGMPTWTGQADLLFIIHSSQDEFLRIVLAPGDVTEAFELSRLSFQLAEDFQLPVFVLSDKHLSESARWHIQENTTFTIDHSSRESQPQAAQIGMYQRYTPTDSGISKRSIPGQKDGLYIANSYEHDEYGLATEAADVRKTQMDKRFTKLQQIVDKIPPQYYQGSPNPELLIITFGSTKSAIDAYMSSHDRQDIAHLNISWMWPFPTTQVESYIQNAKQTVCIEGNKTSQLAQLIRSQTGISVTHTRTKYDGRPFYPSEIAQIIDSIK